MSNNLFGVSCEKSGCEETIELAEAEDIRSTEPVDGQTDEWFVGVQTFDDEPDKLLIDTVVCPSHSIDEIEGVSVS